MKNVTQLLNDIESGQQRASAELLPLVYDELRAMAARKMASERPDSTLQATALVHEAYLRLVGNENQDGWNHRGHFFAAAAEAMRRILVEVARSKSRLKRGGDKARELFHESAISAPIKSDQVLAIDDALNRLRSTNEPAAQLVTLRYFAGFTNAEAAEAMDISPRKANQLWAYARVWLAAEIGEDSNVE